jgi:hypothetical protein
VSSLTSAWPGVRTTAVDLWNFAGGTAFVPVIPTRDGMYLFGAIIHPTDQQDSSVSAELLDPITQQLTLVKRFPSPQHQVIAADADNVWVVWSEASLQPNFEDWTLYAYNRVTRAVKAFAKAATAGGKPVPGPLVQPHVDHDLVVWSAVTAAEPVGSHVDAFEYDLRQGTTALVAHDAIGPAISWPIVVFNQHGSGTGAPPAQLMSLDVTNGTRSEIAGVTNATYFSIVGDTVVWIDEGNKSVRMRTLNDSHDLTLVSFEGGISPGFVQFPSLNERIVAWGQTGGAWAYDRKLRVRVRLAAADPIGTAIVNGRGMYWFYSIDPTAMGRRNNGIQFLSTDLP